MKSFLLALSLAAPTRDPWIGPDKLKHFLLSAMVQSVTVSSARALGVRRAQSRAVGITLTAGVGILRELHDKRAGKGISVRDLVWDAAGAGVAVSLLNGAR